MSSPEISFTLPTEAILAGTPIMLDSIVWTVANGIGLSTIAEPGCPNSGEFRQIFVGKNVRFAGGRPLGRVRLQGLPGERTLLRLWAWEEAEDAEEFRSFCNAFLLELARLGFLEVPEVPRESLGFRPKPSQTSIA